MVRALLFLALLVQVPQATAKDRVSGRAERLYGQWVSGCLPIGKNGRHGVVIQLTVQSKHFELEGQMYARNTCDVPIVASNSAAKIVAINDNSERFRLEIEALSSTMTVNADDVAAHYRNSANCGLNGWQRDEPMHVDGRTCEPLVFPAKGAKLQQDARVSGNQLVIDRLHVFAGGTVSPGIVLPEGITFTRITN